MYRKGAAGQVNVLIHGLSKCWLYSKGLLGRYLAGTCDNWASNGQIQVKVGTVILLLDIRQDRKVGCGC